MGPTRSAAIYARISRNPGQTREGVERQIADCLERIASLPGTELNTRLDGSPIDPKRPEQGYWQPAGVFVDNDVSAARGARKKLKKRPEYDRLMRHVREGD